MDFEERISGALKDGASTLATEESADKAFRDGWKNLKGEAVDLFERTKKRIVEKDFGFGEAVDKDGRVFLEIRPARNKRKYHLLFSKDRETRTVKVETSQNLLPEKSHPVEFLSSTDAEDTVIAFIEAIAADLVATRKK